MPTKEYKQGQLFFGNEEIGFRPLGELTEVHEREKKERGLKYEQY